MIQITPNIAIAEDEIHEEFTRSSGAGGQNVNKVSTAAQLRFDVAHSPSLPDDVKKRLTTLAGRRMTKDGVLLIKAQAHRTQERNRQDALHRLSELIRQAAHQPIARIPTKPTHAAQRRRLEQKRRHGMMKRLRHSLMDDY